MTLTAPHPFVRDRKLFEAGECDPLLHTPEAAAANFTAYDDVTPSLIPSDATHVAYYGNGWAQNLIKMRAACPHALLSPTLLVAATGSFKEFVGWEHGISVDAEPTLFTPVQLAAEAAKMRAEGVMPKAYFPLSWAVPVIAALHAQGFTRSEIQLHSAHWTGVAHICSGVTGTAWGTVTMDATQYTDKAFGRSLDANLCRGTYYGPWGASAPGHPQGVIKGWWTFDMAKGHWDAGRHEVPGSLVFTEHPKEAKSELTVQMHNGAVGIKAT